MPIYEYRCSSCGRLLEALVFGHTPTPAPQCTECGLVTTRIISLVALGKHADPGPGRAAWPSTWRAVDGGNPEAIRYWRRRIERELKEEERNPELSARADAFRRDFSESHSHGHVAPEPFIGPGAAPERPEGGSSSGSPTL
jgi:putative FmdB family regulatory protein